MLETNAFVPKSSETEIAGQLITAGTIPESAEHRFRALIEYSLDAVALINTEGIILYANPATTNILGYSLQEFVGRRARNFIHPEDRTRLTERLTESLRQPKIAIYASSRVLHKDGTWRWTEGNITNLLDEPGVNAFVNSYRDITASIKTEAALRESQARFAGIINSAMDALITIDARQQIRLFNPAAEKMFGWSAADVLGQPLDLLIPLRYQKAHRDHIRGFGDTGVTTRAMGKLSPLRGMRQDQTEFPVEASISQYEIGGEKTFTVILRDISQRKQAEEQIRYQASLIENVSDAIISTGPDQVIKSWNHAAETLYGWRAEEVLGRTAREILQTGFSDDQQEKILNTLNEIGTWTGEVPHKHRDGTPIYVMSAITMLKDNQGNPSEIITANRDVSQLKRARERTRFLEKAGEILASSLDYEETLQTVSELAISEIADWCAFTLAGVNGDLKMVAGAHTAPEQEKLERLFRDKLAPGLNPQTGTARAIRTGKTIVVTEYTDDVLASIYPDPAMLPFLRQLKLRSSISVPLVTQGRVLGAITLTATEGRRRYSAEDIGVAEDLARRAAIAVDNAHLYREARELNEELEQRVQDRTQQLEASNKELEAFSYSVSHDLRAPLRAIDGFSRILMRDAQSELSPGSLRYLKLVRENTQQMGQLVDDLLAFSRLSRQSLNRQTISVSGLVNQVIQDSQEDTQDRDIKWEIGELGTCSGDLALLKQVWVNLIANALKYTRTRKPARIEIGRTWIDNKVVFHVKDNGVGFDMQYAHKLFGVFQRLHRAEDYEGTGVGLAIVHRIITRHGGRVWAEATIDQGAAFYFTLGQESSTRF